LKEHTQMMKDPKMQKELNYYLSSFDKTSREILPYLRSDYYDEEEEERLW
jgi:hypothetical protein